MTRSRRRSVYAENTSLRMLLAVVAVLVVGVLLLIAASSLKFVSSHASLQSVVRDLGGLFVATVIASVIWELTLRRAFLAELLSLIGARGSVRDAGIVWASDNFYDVDWTPLFENAHDFDAWLTYGHSWRGENLTKLASMVTRRSATVRIALPDPEDETLAAELARRYSLESPAVCQEQWRAAQDEFIEVFERPETAARCELWLINTRSPLFSFYRFDETIVLALYRHGPGSRGSVPVFKIERPGSLYTWVCGEFDALLDPENTFARLGYERRQARRFRLGA